MIVTRVQYTVKAEYAERNKENIRRVLDEIRALARTDIQYSVFLEPNGQTFTHLPVFGSEDAQTAFSRLEAFIAFRTQLEASQPEVPPTTTKLTLVGTASAPTLISEAASPAKPITS
jgi:hypothetical protein